MGRAIAALRGEPLPYSERTGPRSALQGKIYTSTDYPPQYDIFLHNENAYARELPGYLAFACFIEPDARGETPIGDCRAIEQSIDASVRERFEQLGWMHVRNIHPDLGPSWQEVFQVNTQQEVEAYCRARDIDIEWVSANHLRTRQVHAAHVTHPRTGERLWCNHATFYHRDCLEPVLRHALRPWEQRGALPNETFYGDGSPISTADFVVLRDAYLQHKRAFRWREGDLLLVDNLRVCHGREPYEGARQIAVGMTTPIERAPRAQRGQLRG